MKKINGAGVGLLMVLFVGTAWAAELLPAHTDETMLENAVQDLRTHHLYLKASQELVEYLAWHPGAENAGRWLEEVQQEEKAAIDSSSSSMTEHLYAEAYAHFFNGEPEKALHDWKTLLGLSLADSWSLDRIAEVREFSDRLEARLNGRRGLEALAQGRSDVAEPLLEKSLKVVFNDEVSKGLQEAREENLNAKEAGRARLKREEIEKLIEEGRLYYQKENWSEARRAFGVVLRSDPSNQEALRYQTLIGQALQSGFDPEKAREYYKEGLRAYQVGQLAEAKGLWETALRLDPASNEAHASLDQLAREWK